MKKIGALYRTIANTEGQAIPFVVLSSVLIMGAAGVTVDLGRAFVVHRELQSSTDAAALAGAYNLSQSTASSATVQAAVTNMSAASGGANARTDLPGVTVTTTLKCLSSLASQGVYCSGSPTGDNAVQVKQSMSVPTYFIRALSLLGVNSAKSLTVTTVATAAMKGATNSQYNVAIVVDTTASMGNNDTDASCNSTRIKCALSGAETLLQSLSPCSPSSTGSSCTPFDQVSLFTFPNVQANTASKDTTCPTSNPTTVSYSTPTPGATWSAPTGTSATYQITTYLSNYSSTNKAGGALNTASALTIATGGKSGCSGMQTPGGEGTYYAGVIYAAQSSLISAQKANPGSLNALIILSDGDASSTKITGGTHAGNVYGSLDDQCQQAITAAKAATAAGTTVYSIAYGASSSGCSTDTSGSLKGLSPCTAMQDMASTSATFYSDATASQNKGQCTSSANPNLSLSGIFKQVATSFTVARLIPDNAT
jgi:hypothetical protein